MPTPWVIPTYTIGSWAANADDDFGVRWGVSNQDTFDGPGIKLQKKEKPTSSGAYRLRSHTASKLRTLEGWAQAPDRAAMLAARDRLLGLFNDGGQQQLIVDDGFRTRFATVELADVVPVKIWADSCGFDWQLPLDAADPRWYDTTLQTGSSQPQSTTSDGLDWTGGGTGGLDWTVGTPGGLDWGSQQSSGVITMTNAGNEVTWPVFTLTGPLVQPRIVASVSGRVLQYNLTLATGETLRIDCSPFTRSVVLNGTTDRFSAMSQAQWISIPANSTESVTLGASGGGALAAAWRSASR